MKPVVLYSSYEAASRDFVTLIPDGEADLIDWHIDNSAYDMQTMPHPSCFPSVVLTVRAAGVETDQVGLLVQPTTWDQVTTAEAMDNADILQSLTTIVIPPDVNGFMFNLLWTANGLGQPTKNILSGMFPSLFSSYLDQPSLIKQAWSGFKASLTAPEVDIIETLAVQFHIPLV